MTRLVQYTSLDASSLTIVKSGYPLIKQLVEEYRCCEDCEKVFTEENPHVLRNQCKVCFLRKYQNLSYLGLASQTPMEYRGLEHKFLNASNGYIYVTGTESDTEPYKDYRQTLAHY